MFLHLTRLSAQLNAECISTYRFVRAKSIFNEICCPNWARNLTTSSFFDICHCTFIITSRQTFPLGSTPKLLSNFTVCCEKAWMHFWQSSAVLWVDLNIASRPDHRTVLAKVDGGIATPSPAHPILVVPLDTMLPIPCFHSRLKQTPAQSR